jgi:hypothetical protein
VGAVRGGTTGVTKTSWCRSAPQFPAGAAQKKPGLGNVWFVGRCEADRPNAGSRLEEPRSAHSLRDPGGADSSVIGLSANRSLSLASPKRHVAWRYDLIEGSEGRRMLCAVLDGYCFSGY